VFQGMTATGQAVSVEIALDNSTGFQRVHFPSELRSLLYVQWQQGDGVTNNFHMFDNVVLFTGDFVDFRELFLHGNGGSANPTSLSLSEVIPRATTAAYKDSARSHSAGATPGGKSEPGPRSPRRPREPSRREAICTFGSG
jgi:hypothetical protein